MSKVTSSSILLLALITSVPLSSHADVLTVRQDGTGQFTTINAAKAIAVGGDVIEVGPGTYHEEIDFSIAVTLVSTHGAAATILDGDDIRRILVFRAGIGSVVDGFTIRNGYHPSSGGGLRVQTGATATVRNCTFEDNYVEFDGGAVICRDSGTNLQLSDCLFLNNRAARHAAGVLVVEDGTATLDRCRFQGNDAPFSGAIAINTWADLTVTNCLVIGNEGATSGLFVGGGVATVRGNTFYGNAGDATVLSLSVTVVERNVFAEEQSGVALALVDNDSHSCNIFWNNAGGSTDTGELGAGDLEADPLFCDAPAGDFTISINSPAAPAHSACDELIGAYPTNCSIGPPPPAVGPVILSIDDVPNDQGLQVRLRWQRIIYDAPSQPHVITGYAVYRKEYGGAPARADRPDVAPGRGRDVAIDGWDYITTVPARGDAIYQVVAPTLCDSKHGYNLCQSVFFVSALTPNPLVFFDSAPDTGQSEDNIPPGQPAALTVDVTEAGVHLAWEPVDDADVVEYHVYRGADSQSLGDPLHVTAGLTWTDTNASGLQPYWVAAVDDAGNVGEPIGSEPSTGAGPIVPNTHYLGQNAPNPFNPSTSIEFGIPAGASGNVTIDIFDVAGKLVRTLLNESRGSGTWRVTWDGTTNAGSRVSSGVYFYRLRTSQFVQTRRMTLVE